MTLAVFSGMPDPEWTVPANQIKGLLAGAKTYHPADMPARPGYKGFVLQNGNTARLVVRAETKKLQLQLLQTMPKDVVQLLQGDLIKLIKKEINTGAVKAEIDSQISKRKAPLYEPGQWQGRNFRRRICNNCYNYAINKATNNYAQPGFRNGHHPYPRDQTRFGPAIIAAAESDGLIRLPMTMLLPLWTLALMSTDTWWQLLQYQVGKWNTCPLLLLTDD